ncbi:uncharacterized protein [Diadema setosum]|uniref:uncharacterized protein n=1 Tax=Diadema setosum TaxID=31175 RepID=UPI003B3A3A69
MCGRRRCGSLPTFWQRAAHKVAAAICIVAVVLSTATDAIHNCSDLILLKGKLVIDTDCGLWYIVCNGGDNDTDPASCLNSSAPCNVTIDDLGYDFDFTNNAWNLSHPWPETYPPNDMDSSYVTTTPEVKTSMSDTSGDSNDATPTNHQFTDDDTYPSTPTSGEEATVVTETFTTTMAIIDESTTELGKGDKVEGLDEVHDCRARYNETTEQLVVLRGEVFFVEYNDDFNRTWFYGVASFLVDGSVYLDHRLNVEIKGRNALRIESVLGHIVVNTTLHVDVVNGTRPNSSSDWHLGGFGNKGGPGLGAPYTSDGAGHGGVGGTPISAPNPEYSQPYLMNDTRHLVGGSAGGVVSDEESAERAAGGGALELIASSGVIYVGALITARGQDGGQTPNTTQWCRGGGSGGLVRFIAAYIEVVDPGAVIVEGGDSALDNSQALCGGGGAGGVVHLSAGGICVSSNDTIRLGGGDGSQMGEDGVLTYYSYSDPLCHVEFAIGNSNDGNGNLENGDGYRGDPSDVETGSGGGESSAGETSRTQSPTNPRRSEKRVQQELQNAVADLPLTSGTSNTSTAEDVTPAEAANQVRQFESALRDVAADLLGDLADNESFSTTATVGDTEVKINIVPASDFRGTSFPSPGDSSGLEADTSGTKIVIPTIDLTENATGHVVSVFILHTSPPPLGGKLAANTNTSVSHQLNSHVISATVSLENDGAVNFNEPVVIVLRNGEEVGEQQGSLCVFYDFTAENETGAWSQEGCDVIHVNSSHTVCECNHLTNFALLLQTTDFEISEKDERILQIISQIGIGLSLVALFVGFFTIAATYKSLHNREAALIHLNLIAAMFIGHMIFVAGVSDVGHQTRCRAVAILIHFFYLATFFWMLMEGVYIYFRATSVFKSNNRQLIIYHALAWGCPVLIVMITAVININFYGTSYACWLSRDRGAVWAFAGPVVVVIVANVIILVIVLQKFLSIKSMSDKSKFEQVKKSTRAVVILLPLLGITWMLGFLATSSSTIFFQYAFAILNSLQGVFICAFHCFWNDDVMKIVKLKYKRSKEHFDAITSQSGSSFARPGSSNSKVGPAPRREAFSESSPSTVATMSS